MLNKKWFLYITEFFAGMSVMAIELGASRLLAPYFSSSQIVWTIIIGTIMIAMALGNIWGGRSADKNVTPDKLYKRLIIVAVWVAAVPFLGKYVIAVISLLLAMLVGSNFLIWASLLSCLVLFVYPLMLLGTVTPSLVKYSVKSLDKNGKTVGELNALNTIGSIIGTFTPTFITIPTVGTSLTFIIFAAILLAISLTYFIFERRHLVRSAIAVILVVVLAIFGANTSFAFFSNNQNIYQDESIYNYLQVTETPKDVRLSTNVLFGVQSVTRKDGKLSGFYYDYALAAPLMAQNTTNSNLRVLILGFGSGTYALECKKYFPNCSIDGVEIDKKIIDLAYSRFYVPKFDPSINVYEFDGRAFLRGAENYDVIMVDAYRDITIPFQMSSVEFFKEVKQHLTKNGVMVINMNMHSSKENSINNYLCNTAGAVFNNIYTADCEGNREVFAFDDNDALERFKNNIKTQNPDLGNLMNKVLNKFTKYTPKNFILTDDKAPVELLGMQVIDELIEDELSYYKELFKGKSITEMINILAN